MCKNMTKVLATSMCHKSLKEHTATFSIQVKSITFLVGPGNRSKHGMVMSQKLWFLHRCFDVSDDFIFNARLIDYWVGTLFECSYNNMISHYTTKRTL